MQGLTADRRLYLTADRAHVVEAGSKDVGVLLAAEGQSIPKAEVERLGLEMEDGKIAYPDHNAPAGTPLPADFPGYDAFLAAGIETLEAVLDFGDYTQIDGIGKKTAADVADTLESLTDE